MGRRWLTAACPGRFAPLGDGADGRIGRAFRVGTIPSDDRRSRQAKPGVTARRWTRCYWAAPWCSTICTWPRHSKKPTVRGRSWNASWTFPSSKRLVSCQSRHIISVETVLIRLPACRTKRLPSIILFWVSRLQSCSISQPAGRLDRNAGVQWGKLGGRLAAQYIVGRLATALAKERSRWYCYANETCSF